MFFDFLRKFFKHKDKITIICPHIRSNVDEFLFSFDDTELNIMRSELIGCEKAYISEHITEILFYLKNKCTEEDYAWFSEEIKNEYKNNK